MTNRTRFLIHAPNVHVGGGIVLLRELFSASCEPAEWAQLDQRIQGSLDIPQDLQVCYVSCTTGSRLIAEFRLWRESQADDVVLCFHGMPPLFPVRGHVLVFQQNRLLLGKQSLAQYPLKVALRIVIERVWCRMFRRHVDKYLVQTPSMAQDLRHRYGDEAKIEILPFLGRRRDTPSNLEDVGQYDFVYVASGEAHKNHERLIDAWLLLAERKIFPSLALTLEAGNRAILDRLEQLCITHGLRVDNLGVLPREQVLGLYKCCRALIFPSTSESFGLPLLEAAASGLPIVAAELDYVRDVVTPVETFDPESAVSIARAVRRFLGCAEMPGPVMTAREFVERILRL